MDREIIQAIANFMGRTTLRGEEVPIFNQCINELNTLINETDITSREEPTDES